jgi:hypothetical protein
MWKFVFVGSQSHCHPPPSSVLVCVCGECVWDDSHTPLPQAKRAEETLTLYQSGYKRQQLRPFPFLLLIASHLLPLQAKAFPYPSPPDTVRVVPSKKQPKTIFLQVSLCLPFFFVKRRTQFLCHVSLPLSLTSIPFFCAHTQGVSGVIYITFHSQALSPSFSPPHPLSLPLRAVSFSF